MASKPELNLSRVKAFNYRAMYHLRIDLGFNLKTNEGCFDVTRGLLTELADGIEDEDKNPEMYARGMARLAIVSRFLEGEEADSLQRDVTEIARSEGLPQKLSYAREFVLSAAVDATRRLRERLVEPAPEPAAQSDGEKPSEELTKEPRKKKGVQKDSYRPARSPDYADLEDVIKYLYEAGVVSPSHAAILLVVFGYVQPKDGVSDRLRNDIMRARNDLRTRITTYQTRRHSTFEAEGIAALESFIAQSPVEGRMQLRLEDADKMIAVGSVLVSIHGQSEVRSTQQFDRPGKYDGMGTIINFDE